MFLSDMFFWLVVNIVSGVTVNLVSGPVNALISGLLSIPIGFIKNALGIP